MDRDFQLGGRNFKVSKVNALKQFHVARRLTPIIGEIIPFLQDAQRIQKAAPNATVEENLEALAKIAGPLITGIGKLSDADSEFVLYTLLEAVEIQQTAGNWARVSVGGMLAMQDLELPVLLQLAFKAFEYNCAGFFSEALLRSTAASGQTPNVQ